MAKARTPIPSNTRSAILFASDRTCCKCEERGRPIQIHHIDEDPSNNNPENLAVLCLLCHDETQTRGGFGRHLSASDVQLYRDEWIKRVADRRRAADALFVERTTSSANRVYEKNRATTSPSRKLPTVVGNLSREHILAYAEALPDILAEAYEAALPHWHGSTVEINRAVNDVIEVVQLMWLRLALGFPRGHFAGVSAARYLSTYLDDRYRWHRALAEPEGPGMGGTITSQLVNKGVLEDMEKMVVDTVEAIWGLGYSYADSVAWRAKWEKSKIRP